MQLNSDILNRLTFLTGSTELILKLSETPAKVPFDDNITEFLNDVSKELMGNAEAKKYPDVVTFAFWIRKGSVLKLKEKYKKDEGLHLGKGVAFHIAPSNVPVNFAYSLAAGLLTGNANVVRVPGKDFKQVKLICDAFRKILDHYESLKPYVICVRYERDKEINDLLSSVSDLRIVWGGDQTIARLRESGLPPRAGEITFADRYSLAVIDSESYLSVENKARVAEDFYNDTYLSDQNACTSPRLVVWTGEKTEEAKRIFWEEERKIASKKYNFQTIQGVNKLAKACLAAVAIPGVKVEEEEDNLIVRVSVPEITKNLMDFRENSGYFYEYDCKNILEILPVCDDKHCQTIGYIGNKDIFMPLFEAGIKGVDRIVPIGKTMDFDLIWDGYNLVESMTRTIVLK